MKALETDRGELTTGGAYSYFQTHTTYGASNDGSLGQANTVTEITAGSVATPNR